MIRQRVSRRTRRNRLGSQMGLSLSGIEQLEARQVLDSTLVFNEVMYNPVGVDDGPNEWIEFHNQLTVDVDVSNWELKGGVNFTFPADTIVPGKGYLVLAADPQAFKQATGVVAIGPWTGTLNNSGEDLRLYNNDERLMNSLSYRDEGEWPVGADGGGASLSKKLRDTASEDPRNWTFSAEIGGTPGRPNFLQPGEILTDKLLKSASPVRAIVPTSGALGTTWTQTTFNDASWLSGKTGVGFATSVSSTFRPLLGLNLDAPPNGQAASPMVNVNSSVYMRIPFNLSGNAQYDGLTLRMRYDDGFVAYLNGVEVASSKAPGRNGDTNPLEWNSASTSSNSNTKAVNFESFDISAFTSTLKSGDNLLAIHGLNFAVSDSDALFDAEIVASKNVQVLPPIPLVLNEIAAFSDANFFVEVKNISDAALPLAGYVLHTDDTTGGRYVFGAQTLTPGQVLSVNKAALGLKIEDGTRLILENANGRILDGMQTDKKLRARADARSSDWQYPSAATPGSANSFQFNDDVVINEIMFNPPPVLAIPDTPATYTRTPIVPMQWDNWRYNATGAELPSDWWKSEFAVDNSNWKLGKGLIGFDTANLGVPFNTLLKAPSENDPRFTTYYFQTDFALTADQIANVDQLSISHLIDAGAVFYLNGSELLRFNMPAGPIPPQTLAAGTVNDASLVGPTEIAKSLLKVGKNTLSAELHLRSTGSSDVTFGAELTLGKQVTPVIPGSPYRTRDELEFIELYNKGSQAIDISGWKLSKAVALTIPAGTILKPNEQIVIAKDAAALSAMHPAARIIGDYSGTLSNGHERILLLDTNGNLADEVEYFDTQPWPATGDGGGSSLELIDPRADNNRPESWRGSDESGKSGWKTYTFSGVSLKDAYNNNPLFHEFLFGLLDAGEFLIDDVVVIKDPNGAAPKSLLQNGTFESDGIGAAPAKWRLIGNHSGIVAVDPTNPNNKVLRVTSTGAQSFVHDHAETTFVSGEKIVDGTEYSISFRTKWLSGNSQLNNRFWFNRLPSTVRMDIPLKNGTPGATNSTRIANAGPTFDHFLHSPATPKINQPVVVTARASDPQGVAKMTLHWRLDGQPWQTVPMTKETDGYYRGTIPGQPTAGAIVQFYAQADDGSNATAAYPMAGPNSRALFQVNDGKGPTTPIDKVRMVIMKAELDKLFAQVNRMSNWTLPMTLIYNDTPYYQSEVRQTGSRWIRPNSGYKVDFPAGRLLYGLHESIRLDINGLAELVMKQMLNRAGGSKASNYDDVAYLVSNRHSQEFILQLARYENIYLEEQFENGADGTKWELDDVTVPTGPIGGVEGLKADTAVYEQADFGVNTATVNLQGDNPEFYRAHLLIKSSRQRDNYDAIARFTKAIHQTGDALFKASNQVMDVDLWMRHYSHQAYFGNWDTYGFARPKNLRLYQRPDDGKMIPLFWDCDLCNFTEPLKKLNEPTSRLDEIRDIPHNLRLYWGHMLDFINRSFNEPYAARWANHYGALLNNQVFGGDETFQTIAASTRARSAQALTEMRRDIPVVSFDITSNGGQPIQTDKSSFTLEGKGWIDVRQIRIAGTEKALDAFWPTKDGWQIQIPLIPGQQTIALEAINYQGQLIASDSIQITSTAVNPTMASLRLTEIQYNPGQPNAAETAGGFANNNDFEYIELMNTGKAPISLLDTELVRVINGADEQGVEFRFAKGKITSLDPGKTVLVVENEAAFRARYGNSLPVAGEWIGGLSNTGEKITVAVQSVKLHEVTYADSWHPATDGTGRALEIINPTNPSLASWNIGSSWQATSQALGSPGVAPGALIPGDSNHDGIFNSADLVYVMQFGKYENGIPNSATFEEGDWNGDGQFTTTDFVFVFALGSYTSAARPAAQPTLSDLTPWLDPIHGTSPNEELVSLTSAGLALATTSERRAADLPAPAEVEAVFEEWQDPQCALLEPDQDDDFAESFQ